ncbi:acyl-CoA dehydrogenase family protein [Antrihabitans sp. YC3-6]|uniref:Acyl-CoA dehydrogenase family protein n=1 Tax=Antrihabitans stalagmiti TaxID=2799499 RepID=A0A934NLV9_9NOCA|nr:acyl-CoA dehydrogenase family protein [Antrihabitans stalagmiti]MBJ8337570.1 acyl-CoA dehydrogenase family protein [Antrihabitans stalagmiti]
MSASISAEPHPTRPHDSESHDTEAHDTVATQLLAAEQAGALDLPLPGAGHTIERWHRLAQLSFRDTVVGRLAEAHTDAVAILAEITGRSIPNGSLWGVWAAQPPKPALDATRRNGRWVLDGRKLWCSGATMCTHALVTALCDENWLLFEVDLRQPGVQPVPDTWHAVGMSASDSGAVDFTAADAEAVGEAGDYIDRAGFWHGAIGVAACWYGSACGVAKVLHAAAARGRADEHALAHLGSITVALRGAAAALETAAHAIDGDPYDRGGQARIRARATRAVVEQAASTTIDRVGRALGAGPLCADPAHARRVADLTVYLRQSHAERDLADLGRDVAEKDFTWWHNR